MRTLFSAITLTILISSITHAGLDTDGIFNDALAVYTFEGITDSGPRKIPSVLQKGASLTDEGKYGKSLKLLKGAAFLGVEIDPISLAWIGSNFSSTAWLKLQKNSEIFITISSFNGDELQGFATIRISSDKLMGGYLNANIDENHGLAIENHTLRDNKWHHIVYSKYAGNHMIFIDGKIIKREPAEYIRPVTGGFYFISISNKSKVPSTIYVDEVGFFERGLSIYEIRGLYNSNLTKFLKAMPVDPQAKKATTWGEIKRRY